MRSRLGADVKEHAAIAQFDRHSLARITNYLTGYGHAISRHGLATLPGQSAVIAVDRRHIGRAVAQLAGPEFGTLPGRHPDRHDQSSARQLDAMARSGGDDTPGISSTQRLQAVRDLDRFVEIDAVVLADHVENTCVVVAKEGMDRAVAVSNQNKVADRPVAVVSMGDNELRRLPGIAAVHAAPHEDVIVRPVSAGLTSRFDAGQDDAVSGADDAGYTIVVIAAGSCFEESGFVVHVSRPS